MPVSSPSRPDLRHAYGPMGLSPWLDIDWRKHQHWTIINDLPVNLVEFGQGPPLLFIHGLSGSWPNWLEQLPVFASSHRVIAVDLPGFGHSAMPSERISISSYARAIDALLDAHDVDAAAVVGNSMGGFIAAELAINFPQRVERLALVSPAGISSYENVRGTRALRGIRLAERPIAACTGWVAAHADAFARRAVLRYVALNQIVRHPRRLPAPIAAEQLRGAGKPGFIQALQANLDYDFRSRIAEIACPTLIVWGDRDRIVTVSDAARYAELIQGSRKVVFEDTGHLAMLERPAAFNALLEEFLSE